MTSSDQQKLRQIRIAVFVLFTSFGVVLATWAVHLPTLQRAAGLSSSGLGTILLALGVGALAGMQAFGPLSNRFGPIPVTIVSSCAMALAVNLPVNATQPWFAGAGALVFGVCTGLAEVSMNAVAVAIERDYRRPIMSSFHAMFSVGNVIGSICAAAAFALAIPTAGAVASVTGCCAVAVVGARTLMRGWSASVRDEHARTDGERADHGSREQPSPRRSQIVALCVMAFLFLLCEGAAMDWSSIHAQEHLDVSASQGTIAFGTFVTAMTISRFNIDRIAARFGPVAVIRWGSVLAFIGIATVMLAPTYSIVLVGWLLFGLGLAGGIPQVFTAAGNLDSGSHSTLSRVVSSGYVALLAGPALIGWVGEISSINAAMLIPLCALVVCGVGAGVTAGPAGGTADVSDDGTAAAIPGACEP